MKNRILCRLVSLGTAVLFAAGTAAGLLNSAVYGGTIDSGNTEPLSIVERAYWTEEENFRGELEVEITGLKEWLEKYKRNDQDTIDELPGGITATPIPAPYEKPSEEETDKAETDKAGEEESERQEPDRQKEEQRIQETDQEITINPLPPEEEDGETPEDTGEIPESELENSHMGNLSGEESQEEENQEQEEEENKNNENSKDAQEEKDKEIPGASEALTSELSASSAIWRSGIRKMGSTEAGSEGTEQRSEGTEQESEEPGQESKELEETGQAEFMLVTRISRYFLVDREKLPKECTAQELMFPGQEEELEAAEEVIYPITMESYEDMPVTVTIPFVLREEYRYSENSRQLPVHLIARSSKAETAGQTDAAGLEPQDDKEMSGAGTFLIMEEKGEQRILAKAGQELMLEASATPADYTLSVGTDTEKPKAGQPLNYYITITNTGRQPLPLISLESAVNPAGLTGQWKAAENSGSELETDASGQKAILTNLNPGEKRELIFRINLPESQTEPVIHTVTAKAQKTTDSVNTVVRGTSLKTTVTPLKADFSVEKSADRTAAAAGDTITYQICIRNTGERTLHSVLSTERFQAENISAQFVEKEGVVLNGTKTQALISKIPPGEVFSLEAVVTLPEKLTSKELINQVVVRTKETGDKTVQSTAGVKILEISQTPEPTKEPSDLFDGDNTSEGGASPVSDYPKTSDDTELAFWICMLGLAFLAGVGTYGFYQFRRKI